MLPRRCSIISSVEGYLIRAVEQSWAYFIGVTGCLLESPGGCLTRCRSVFLASGSLSLQVTAYLSLEAVALTISCPSVWRVFDLCYALI